MIIPPPSLPSTKFDPDDPQQQYARGYLHATIDVVELVLDGLTPDGLLAWESTIRDAV